MHKKNISEDDLSKIKNAAYSVRTILYNDGINLEPTNELVDEDVKLAELVENNETTMDEALDFATNLLHRTKKTIQNYNNLRRNILPLISSSHYFDTAMALVKKLPEEIDETTQTGSELDNLRRNKNKSTDQVLALASKLFKNREILVNNYNELEHLLGEATRKGEAKANYDYINPRTNKLD